jgi:GNAT superfamily N-acetyltransferase
MTAPATGEQAAVTIREWDLENDLPRMVELLNTVEPEPMTVDNLREWLSLRPEGTIERRTAAVDTAGTVLGFGWIDRQPWLAPGRFHVDEIVDPAHRGRGVGSVLFEDLLAFARGHGATRLETEVRDHLEDAKRFAEHRGFETDRHIFESTLDLATFDESPFVEAIEQAQASGIRFLTMADEGDTEEARRKLYEINRDTMLDVPGRDDPFRPWDEFKKVFQMSWYRADGQHVAADGDRYVGLAAVGMFKENNSAYHMMTGVAREYRGRDIAMALKLLSIRRAKEWGVTHLRTNNDSKNEPMLAINQKLGYRPQPGFYKMLRHLR